MGDRRRLAGVRWRVLGERAVSEIAVLLKGGFTGEVRRAKAAEEVRGDLVEFAFVHFQVVLQREVFVAEGALVGVIRRRMRALVRRVFRALVSLERGDLAELLAALGAEARLFARVNERVSSEMARRREEFRAVRARVRLWLARRGVGRRRRLRKAGLFHEDGPNVLVDGHVALGAMELSVLVRTSLTRSLAALLSPCDE